MCSELLEIQLRCRPSLWLSELQELISTDPFRDNKYIFCIFLLGISCLSPEMCQHKGERIGINASRKDIVMNLRIK